MWNRAMANVCPAFPPLILFYLDGDNTRGNTDCRATTTRFPSPFVLSTKKLRQNRIEVRSRGSRNQVSNYERETIIDILH